MLIRLIAETNAETLFLTGIQMIVNRKDSKLKNKDWNEKSIGYQLFKTLDATCR